MTRINVVPVDELHPKHLTAEYREITRVFTLVTNSVDKELTPKDIDTPEEYTLGKGHVKFFYDKLQFISRRYAQLHHELTRRGGNPNTDMYASVLQSARDNIPAVWWKDYLPTPKAIRANRIRIAERIREMKR